MNNEKLATLIDLESVEPGALQQIREALEHPWLKRLAIMPDVHQGYDLPIGSVALTDGVISPSFVGYDIGCGMTCYYTSFTDVELGLDKDEKRQEVLGELRRAIPMGKGIEHAPFSHHGQCLASFKSKSGDKRLSDRVNAKAVPQLGTLGGGNHFIEVGLSTDRFRGRPGHIVCITIHSGSRRPGWDIANHYMGGKDQKTYLFIGSEEGRAYWKDMRWAHAFALESRLRMMAVAIEVVTGARFPIAFVLEKVINENHNTAEILPNGDVLHRKGATPAALGVRGVIPGDMSTGVYVTAGLGNADYLWSASHGAGRVMSRSKARKTIGMDRFRTSMEGITAMVNEATIDEAPQAYKDIEAVIAAQDGVVVEVIDHIRPIINVKGV